jgi:HSP20 family protein
MKDTRSFFEKLTGAVKISEDHFDADEPASFEPEYPKKSVRSIPSQQPYVHREQNPVWTEEEPEEGQLTVDVYQTGSNIVVKCMVAGVKPEDLEITITRDMVTIKGRRETEKTVSDEDYFHQELYWGSFSRTVMLPAEIDVEEAEAIEKHGLLIITLPKIDKNKQTKLKVKG